MAEEKQQAHAGNLYEALLLSPWNKATAKGKYGLITAWMTGTGDILMGSYDSEGLYQLQPPMKFHQVAAPLAVHDVSVGETEWTSLK